MATKPTAPDPYSAFKDDTRRLIALIARDLRYVAIAGLLLMANQYVPWRFFLRWLNA
jgi:hypothetical protein